MQKKQLKLKTLLPRKVSFYFPLRKLLLLPQNIYFCKVPGAEAMYGCRAGTYFLIKGVYYALVLTVRNLVNFIECQKTKQR